MTQELVYPEEDSSEEWLEPVDNWDEEELID